MAAGLFEMELDMDPEDHLEATKPLAYCYVALGEYESFDEIVDDISDKYPEKEILKLWSEFRRTGRLPSGEMIHFRKSFPVFYAEFTSDKTSRARDPRAKRRPASCGCRPSTFGRSSRDLSRR